MRVIGFKPQPSHFSSRELYICISNLLHLSNIDYLRQAQNKWTIKIDKSTSLKKENDRDFLW
jgi:hypothetical protein